MKKTLSSLMGIEFTHLTRLGAIGVIAERIALRHYSRPLTVFTPNVEQLIQAHDDQTFLKDLNSAEVKVPDSTGLVLADWWRAATTGHPWVIRERVAGSDLSQNLIAEAANEGWKVVLVGGMDNAAELACERLKKRFSGLQIWWAPAPQDVNKETGVEFRSLVRVVDRIQPDLLLVGFGAPKQERWVLKHKDELSAQVVMVVGGVIDIWAGRVKRAPLGLQRMGLEWLWRLVQEPTRAKRQTRLLKFVGKVLQGKV